MNPATIYARECLFQKFISIGVGAVEGAARSYQVGLVQSLPWVRNVPVDSKVAISAVALECVNLRRIFDSWDETTSLFVSHVGSLAIDIRSAGLCLSYEKLSQTALGLAFALVEKSGTAEKLIREMFGADEVENLAHASLEQSLVQRQPDNTCFATAYCSYMLGIAFGRWDIRFATGGKAAPELPEPFAPLPVCPPGQLQNAQGLPVEKSESGKLKAENYPIEIPWDGILVDDPNHPLDIERRIREVIEIIWGKKQTSENGGQRSGGATPETIEHEACEILGVKSLREYFRKPAGFFADHLKRYSKSRRQAPIYWPLSTASGSYTLWIYYHRLTDQTLFQCVNDFVKPKLQEVNRDLERLQKPDVRDQKSAREKLEELQDFAAELREFHDELLRVAGMPYKPDLNDGVLITASPLWALFRLPKWQKDLRSCCSALEDGEYDWAHLAYSIWPDRVKEVCKTDRSVAIAHGLENLCDVKAPEKKAKRRKTVKQEIEQQDLV